MKRVGLLYKSLCFGWWLVVGQQITRKFKSRVLLFFYLAVNLCCVSVCMYLRGSADLIMSMGIQRCILSIHIAGLINPYIQRRLSS
jgi:hypothetical protein